MLFRTLLVVAPMFALAAPVASQAFGVAYAGGLSPCLDVNASSANTSDGFAISARQIAARCFSPCDN